MTDVLETFKQLGLESAVFLPIPRGEKGPRLPGWHKKTLADMSDPAYLRLFEEDGNVGVVLGAASGNLSVIDIDDEEWVNPFLAANPGLATTLRTRGSRGCSFWVRIVGEYPKPGKLKDTQGKDVIEWRADRQQSVIHGLHPKGDSYRILVANPPIAIRFEDIVWPPGLDKPWDSSRTALSQVGVQIFQATPNSMVRRPASPRIIDHARKYLAKVSPAISENAGHDQTFTAACILVKGFDLSIDEARPLLQEYNQKCVPQWEEHDLEHKLQDAHEAQDTRARGYLRRPDPEPKFNADLPTVIIPGNGETFSESARKLFSLIGPTHTMFVRGNQIVELYQDDHGTYRLQIVSPSAFRSRVEMYGNIVGWRMGRGDTPVLKPLPMPEETAKGLLATKEAKALLPKIRAVINCPVFISDVTGERIISEGYDPVGVLVAGGKTPPEIPLAEAVHKIKLLIQDFDFATPSDGSRALASILTPALKLGGHLKGSVPADVAEADQSQAGKTYRQRIIAAIYNESPAMVLQRSGGVGSLDETLAQHLLNGATFIQLDNVRGKTNSPYVEALLTADKSFPVRVPYHGTVDIDPSRFFIFLTSNGVEVTRDLANRSSLIRIRKRPGHEFPLYPEGDLLAHVRANQTYYLGCVFAIVREWIKQGRQRSKEYRHDFREWAQTLDWIVQLVFGACPLLDGHQQTQDRISSPAMSFLRDFAQHVKAARLLDREMSASEIYEIAQDEGIEIPGLRDSSEKTGQQTIGRIMGKVFHGQETSHRVSVDGFAVERVIRQVYHADRQEHRDKKFYSFSIEDTKAVQLPLPHHSP